jgi:hypothetical protein
MKKKLFFLLYFFLVSNRINRRLCITSQRQRTEKADVIGKMFYIKEDYFVSIILYPDRIVTIGELYRRH